MIKNNKRKKRNSANSRSLFIFYHVWSFLFIFFVFSIFDHFSSFCSFFGFFQFQAPRTSEFQESSAKSDDGARTPSRRKQAKTPVLGAWNWKNPQKRTKWWKTKSMIKNDKKMKTLREIAEFRFFLNFLVLHVLSCIFHFFVCHFIFMLSSLIFHFHFLSFLNHIFTIFHVFLHFVFIFLHVSFILSFSNLDGPNEEKWWSKWRKNEDGKSTWK